nr:berberine bridge enzyme-like 22 [Quercus suber]
MRYLTLVFVLLLSISWATSYPTHETFMQCMATRFGPYTKSVEIIYASKSSLYSYLLQSSQQNPRWLNSTTPKPLLIITPFQESEIQAAILCSKKYGLQIRINLEDETAWVQSGATLGELYYSIAKKSEIHGFPAGIFPSVGVGGHFSGGGFGTLLRKYGLAADNVLDAYLINVNGEIVDREAMGEDLFWAIRGGGGASFGIILSWKIKLVRVPPTVTAFIIRKKLEQGATMLVSKWQYIADKLHEDLFIRVIIQDVGNGTQKTVQASFQSLFLAGVDRLIPLMNESFPELGLEAQDCIEMNWIQSLLYFNGYQKGDPLEVLLDRTTLYKSFFKAKSDFVKEPISYIGLEGIWDRFLKEDMVFMIMDPYGGRMNEISESETPFPHRKGNLYNLQYLVKWEVNIIRESNKLVHWIRMLYKYINPYVSKYPRAAYLNYRDLDLGTNKEGSMSYSEARVWGVKYF